MAKVWLVKDVNDAPDGGIVTAFKGKVVKVTKRFAGVKDGKPWSFQHATVKDGSGNTIKVTFKGCAEIIANNWEGKELNLLAHKGDKGWSGVYAKDDTYEGKTSRILQITKSAAVTIGGKAFDCKGGAKGKSEDDEPRHEEETDEAQSGGGSGSGSSSGSENDSGAGSSQGEQASEGVDEAAKMANRNVVLAKIQLARTANLYLLSVDAAVHVGKTIEAVHQIVVHPEWLASMSATLFISLQRDGVEKGLPAKPVHEIPVKK